MKPSRLALLSLGAIVLCKMLPVSAWAQSAATGVGASVAWSRPTGNTSGISNSGAIGTAGLCPRAAIAVEQRLLPGHRFAQCSVGRPGTPGMGITSGAGLGTSQSLGAANASGSGLGTGTANTNKTGQGSTSAATSGAMARERPVREGQARPALVRRDRKPAQRGMISRRPEQVVRLQCR